jgi:hypothetical protein
MWVRVGTPGVTRSHRIENDVEDRHRSRSARGRGRPRVIPPFRMFSGSFGGGVEMLHLLRAVPVTRISHDEGPTTQRNSLASWKATRESRGKPRLALC